MRVSKPLALILLSLPTFAMASSDWLKVPATYEVPVTPNLEEYATFELQDAHVRTANGMKVIRYTLPLELTGTPKEIELRESPDQDGLFIGSNARAICKADTCELHYPNLQIDKNEVEKFLAKIAFDPEELRERLAVFESFRSSDPAGIIRLRKQNDAQQQY